MMTNRLAPALAAVALAGLGALLPATASAQTVQLGETTTPIGAPACPAGTSLADCKIVLTKTTAVQTASDGVINPTRVNQQGWIVSFSVGLSQLSSNRKTRASIIKNLDASYGAPSVALTVLRPGPDNTFTVVGQGPTFTVTPFLGQVLQQPLSLPPRFTTFTALPVLRGDVVALTVPTWAPVLSYDLTASQFAYRQSRRARCNDPANAQTDQTQVRQVGHYLCSYTGTRVEYSATEVTDTKVPKTYVGQTASAQLP